MHIHYKMIEIKLDYKKLKGEKKDFIKLPSMLSSTSCVFYQHGSEYIRKVSLLGTSPNKLFLCMGIRLLVQLIQFRLTWEAEKDLKKNNCSFHLYLNAKSPHLE